MIKRVIEQIFQGHAADSLRKTLAEVERAASGKLHNESLADYVTRLASLNYDAQKTTKELEMYRDENERHHATSAENGRIDEEPVEDYMVRIWDGMNVAQRFAEDQKEKLEKAQKEWQERDAAQSKSFNRRLDELAEEAIKQKFRADDIQRELAKAVSMANERAQEISQLRGTHADYIARIDKLSAQLAEIESHSTECGRNEGETTAEFITRQHRSAADRQTALDRASVTIEKLTSDLTIAIVDKALAGNGATEVARLSALVAELQVELDDARGTYDGIMAQLGNETPMQLIERMQRLAQDRRASTIPHDERAMLVAESADLRKRLEASQKAHAKTEHELGGKLRAALATVENQSAAIAEAKQATEKYTAVVEAADKLKEWASTIRHKVLVAMVHTRAMAEYDTIMKELDGKAGTDGC